VVPWTLTVCLAAWSSPNSPSEASPVHHQQETEEMTPTPTTSTDHTPARWGQIRRARWGQIKLTFPDPGGTASCR
jgi:hypothetical protein